LFRPEITQVGASPLIRTGTARLSARTTQQNFEGPCRSSSGTKVKALQIPTGIPAFDLSGRGILYVGARDRRHLAEFSPPPAEVAATVTTAAALRIGFCGPVFLKVVTSIVAREHLVSRRITADVGSAAGVDELNLDVLRPT
jgi:hypothetical protein